MLTAGGIQVYVDNHQFSDPNTPVINQGYQPTLIKNSIRIKCGVWIGVGVIILIGVALGEIHYLARVVLLLMPSRLG